MDFRTWKTLNDKGYEINNDEIFKISNDIYIKVALKWKTNKRLTYLKSFIDKIYFYNNL